MTSDYEYTGMMAAAWDLLRGDTSTWGDRHFFRQLIEQRGGPALDVGCGTGRLLLDFLAAGLDVDGVEVSPEMLALCRAKAAVQSLDVAGRLYEQAMENLDLPRRYQTIFVPSLSIQLLTDPAAATQAMTRFHDHLAAGGVLAAAFRSRFWPRDEPPPQMQWSDWAVDAEAERPEDGVTIRRWVRLRFDHDRQLMDEGFRYEAIREGTVLKTEHLGRVPTLRWYSQDQARALFENAGFTDVRITSDDSFEPARPTKTRFKIIAVRPATGN
jgi:SAM-dependent methyltransferase